MDMGIKSVMFSKSSMKEIKRSGKRKKVKIWLRESDDSSVLVTILF